MVYAEVNAQLHLVCRDGQMNAPSIAVLGAVAQAFDFGAPLLSLS